MTNPNISKIICLNVGFIVYQDADTDEDAFMNYVADLAEKGRVASSRSGRIIC